MEVAQRIGQNVSFSTCMEEWDGLSNDYERFMEKHKEYRKTADLYQSQRQSCKSQIDRQLKKLKLLKSALLNAELIQASLDRVPTEQEKLQLLSKVEERKRVLEDLSNFLPKKNGFYLSLVVGQLNVTLDSSTEKYRFKDEYERFKLYCSILMLIYAAVLHFFITYRVLDAVFSYLLLWYYCTLTVRESILIVNGSRIKGWWVLHHYITALLSGTNVLWTDGSSYQEFRPYFMAFSVYQSLVQLMQYYYQSGCLYRLRALGERHDMDITVEGFQSWMWRGLTFLLPFLFFGHLWQLFNAVKLAMIAASYNFTEWQVPTIAFLFFVLFCGNFFTTINVVLHKQKKRKEIKQS